MAILLVRDERQGGAEQPLPVSGAVFTIGKKQTNDLVLDRANISREHCLIMQRDGGYVLRDLKSRNGTYLDGVRIARDAPLRDGSHINLGDFLLTFRVAAQAPSAPPAEPETALVPKGEARPAALRRTPVELKKKMHAEILARLDLKHQDFDQKSDEELRRKTGEAAREAVAKLAPEIPAWLAPDDLIREVVHEAVGLGPVEDLLADNTVDEIMVNGWSKVYVERFGKLELSDKQFTGDEQVVAVIRRILAPIGRRIDESSPMVDARLADGSRVNAIIPPLSLTGPTLTIRKFARKRFTDEDLLGFGTLNRAMRDFLKLCVEQRRNICISGGTGSGKTTLLNVLSNFIPVTERIVTIEDAAELKLGQEHVVRLEAKPASIEGKGAIPIRKLMINCLRMRPDRIIIGECRGGEALDMLQAMNTGHDGSLTTLHANSVRDALARLETMVLMAGMELPSRAIREQVASAIQIIVQESRLVDGSRKIVTIAEITGMEDDTIQTQEIFLFEQTGFDDEGRVVGRMKATGQIPRFVHELQERGIPVDLGMFERKEE